MTASDSAAANVPLEVDCRTVQQRLQRGDSFLFLDCREQDEYATAKISGAKLLPMSEIASRISEYESEKNSDVIVHCHHGGRSLRVAMWLRQQGFPKAQSMAGGIEQWSLQIDPTVPRY